MKKHIEKETKKTNERIRNVIQTNSKARRAQVYKIELSGSVCVCRWYKIAESFASESDLMKILQNSKR